MTAMETKKSELIQPFSNGTEHAYWQDVNCESCKKCYQPPIKKGEQQWPSDKTMRQYVRDGRECEMKYVLDISWIEGKMPLDVAERIGYSRDFGLDRKCKEWQDRGNGGNPRRPKAPKPVPDNQMVMPFILEEIGERQNVKVTS